MRKYTSIPTLSQWKSDSIVALVTRKNDKILSYIDTLLGQYQHRAKGYEDMVVLSDLFFTLDYWLKIYKTNLQMEKSRVPAIQALYEVVAQVLSRIFNTTINVLPRELETHFGCTLSVDGNQVDVQQKRANYLKRSEITQYRLRFMNGKAYQFAWWNPKLVQEWVLANSKKTATYMHIGQVVTEYGFFTMSMSRDIYMMKHKLGDEGKSEGIYHSTYLAGEAAMCAGSMLIREGVIERVRSDSGHYKPTDANMLGLLQALRMRGVSIENILVEAFTGAKEVKAPDFIAANGDPTIFSSQQTNNHETRKVTGAFDVHAQAIIKQQNALPAAPKPASKEISYA